MILPGQYVHNAVQYGPNFGQEPLFDLEKFLVIEHRYLSAQLLTEILKTTYNIYFILDKQN